MWFVTSSYHHCGRGHFEVCFHFDDTITDFIGLPYFSGFSSGLKSHVLLSHDYLSQSNFVLLPRDRAAMCARPASNNKRNSVL